MLFHIQSVLRVCFALRARVPGDVLTDESLGNQVLQLGDRTALLQNSVEVIAFCDEEGIRCGNTEHHVLSVRPRKRQGHLMLADCCTLLVTK